MAAFVLWSTSSRLIYGLNYNKCHRCFKEIIYVYEVAKKKSVILVLVFVVEVVVVVAIAATSTITTTIVMRSEITSQIAA